MKNSYEKAKNILNENLDMLHGLADLLLEKETVMGSELDDLIHSINPGIKLPQQGQDAEVNEEEVKS